MRSVLCRGADEEGARAHRPGAALLFPRLLIEDTIAMAARNFVLPWAGTEVRHGALGEEGLLRHRRGGRAHIVDPVTGEYRESLAAGCL